jgi:hypothetical protein
MYLAQANCFTAWLLSHYLSLMRLLLCIFLSCISYFAFAQSIEDRTCATEEYANALKQQFPALKLQHQQTKQAIQRALQHREQNSKNMLAGKVSVPVVFHILYKNPEQNISDDQIFSQLDILNADFNRLNADAVNTPSYFQEVAADAGIEFCLANIDPDGDPTTGITRTITTRSSFSSLTDNVKFSAQGGKDAWDTSEYLNIWVCQTEGNVLGYASFPGVTSAGRDGVVLLYTTVGSLPANVSNSRYNLGRTATHEVGHWLGLSHLWGSGSGNDLCEKNDDGIDDTPPQNKPTHGCPGGIILSCNNGPTGNMWQNYMDYTDDACMNLFTKGQAGYMQAVISSARASILRSLACTGELRANFRITPAEDSVISAGNSIRFEDAYEGARPNSWLWEFEGGTPAISREQNPQVVYKNPGKYNVKLTISNGQMSSTTVKEELVYVTANELLVYPVPASDFVTIEQPARIELQHIQLINHFGQVVLNEQATGRMLKLKVNHLASGIYFLKIWSTDGITTKRVLLTR